MLSTEPVTRLSRTTTSSPRASSASHRCDPEESAASAHHHPRHQSTYFPLMCGRSLDTQPTAA